MLSTGILLWFIIGNRILFHGIIAYWGYYCDDNDNTNENENENENDSGIDRTVMG